MDLADYLALPYRIEIHPEVVEGQIVYVATHPELIGCRSHGDTPEEALASLREARELYIRTAVEDGVELPLPELDREAA
jgi:antitoxin HicB